MKAIEYAISSLERPALHVFDRGYDNNLYFDKFINEYKDQDFLIRLKNNRLFQFKTRFKNVGQIARERKGKIKSEVWFQNEKYEVYCSHTRVKLPKISDKDLYLIMVYGIGKEPMLLLTNRKVDGKTSLIELVRAYFSRWRIEEHFRFIKQVFNYEDMRIEVYQGQILYR